MGQAPLTWLPDSTVEALEVSMQPALSLFPRGCIFTADPSHLQAKQQPCVELGGIPYLKTVKLNGFVALRSQF